MERDLLYYFDKRKLAKYQLGEVQTNFNMSFVIDGTKDSAKVIVYSFEANEVEPNTILWHRFTDTWWIASNDKVSRIENESNFLYKHELQIIGAIELLNARDLTDSGFYANRYTIGQSLNRILDLSNFEIEDREIIALDDCIDLNKVVDYIKTYENYTLLSAIREFLNGYNCCAKLSFDTRVSDDIYGDTLEHIYKYNLLIYPKTGLANNYYQESVFNYVRELKTIGRDSFGTSVVSNAENVISTKSKTYPTSGVIKISSSSYNIDAANAIIRLPSNAYKVNYVQVYRRTKIKLAGNHFVKEYDLRSGGLEYIERIVNTYLNDYQDKLKELQSQTIQTDYQEALASYNEFVANKDDIIRRLLYYSRTTFYSGVEYDAINNRFIAPSDNPNFYIPQFYRPNVQDPQYPTSIQMVLANKQLRDSLYNPSQAFYYETGKDTISGFNGWSSYNGIRFLDSTDYRLLGLPMPLPSDNWFTLFLGSNITVYGAADNPAQTENYRNIYYFYFVVNYIPMSDMKVKYDNSGYSKDAHLYNQNGKLTDSVALSKLMLSYSKEIESDNITKYGYFYDFDKVPMVGSIVEINNQKYVINSVSLDFYQNEESVDTTYFIDGEFTLSKNIAVKSLLTNPNTNIRDYGIPQNNNVFRKQVYRDFYELAHTIDTNADSVRYLPITKVLNLSNEPQQYNEHMAVMKLTYKEEIFGDDTYYYQLNTTTFVLKKAIYEIINFKDNNIIGYDAQNVYSGFDITKLFLDQTVNVNIPISYVDTKGEVESIDIAMCSGEQINEVYKMYQDYEEVLHNTTYSGSMSISVCFIDEYVFSGINTYGTNATIPQQTFTEKIDITSYVTNTLKFKGDPQYITVENFVAYYTPLVPAPSQSYNYEIIKEGNSYYFYITGWDWSNISIDYRLSVANVVGAADNCDFHIVELAYKKDAIEVPMFEYSCQIDDSDDVIIGENILDLTDDAETYIYSFVLVNKNIADNNNAYKYREIPKFRLNSANNGIFYVDNGAIFEVENNQIKITLGGEQSFNVVTNEIQNGSPIIISDLEGLYSKDILVFRHKLTKNTTYESVDGINYVNSVDDLMVVIKNTTDMVITNNKIVLKVNHYSLK